MWALRLVCPCPPSRKKLSPTQHPLWFPEHPLLHQGKRQGMITLSFQRGGNQALERGSNPLEAPVQEPARKTSRWALPNYKPWPPRLPSGLPQVQLHTSVSPGVPHLSLHSNILISLHSGGAFPSLSDGTTCGLLGIDHADPSQSPVEAEPGKETYK